MINQVGFGLTPTTYNNAFSSTVTQFQQPYEQSKFNTALNQTVGYGNSALSSGIASAASSVIQDGTKSLGQGFVNGLGSFTNGASLGGLALNVASGLIGNKTEYSGDKGAITKGLDTAYDTISDGISVIPGFGTAAGLIMKGGALVNKALNKWTGSGTDGMCVCAGTKVFTASGEEKNIEDLQLTDGIIGWSETTKKVTPQKIHDVITTSEKECLEITLKSGQVLRCSIDHPILSHKKERAESHYIDKKRIAYRNWEFNRADELQVGNFVGIANNIDFWGSQELSKAYLIGLLISDGTYTKGNSCRLVSVDPDTWKYIEDNNLGVINKCNGLDPTKYTKELRTYRIIGGMDLMRKVGLVYQYGKYKTLPKDIGKYTKKSICSLIAGLFDTDGSINCVNNKPDITLYHSNLSLLKEVKTQLHKLGIFCTINTRKARNYQLGGKIIHSNESYRLCINDKKSVINFYNNIPININYKKNHLEDCYRCALSKKDQEHNLLSGAKQSKIISIKPIGKQIVYNLQADFDHTYIANGIITHNTNTDAILGSNFLGLTPIGLINGWAGKNAYTMMKDSLVQKENLGNMWNAYGSTLDLYQDAQHKAGKKYGYFSSDARKKANKIITRAALAREDLLDMNRQRETGNIRAGMTDANISKYALALNGGYQPLAVGRHGFKFHNVTPTRIYKLTKADKDKIKEIVKRAKNKEYKFLDVRKEDIHNWDKLPSDAAPVAYQNGGVFNLIPEGALHARKHHMEDDENITKKGIPVVDNNGKQQAEIECNEIIFRKEVTDKIEQLSEDGSDDAAIECGKLLSIEIMENTQDRTNLIPKAQNGMSFNQWSQLSVPQQVSALSVDPKLNTTPSVLSDVQSKTKQSDLNKYNTKQALAGMGVSLVGGLINTFNSQKEADAKRKQAQEQQYNQMIQNSMTQEQLLQRQRQTLANEYAMKEINGPTFNSNMVW